MGLEPSPFYAKSAQGATALSNYHLPVAPVADMDVDFCSKTEVGLKSDCEITETIQITN
ncbi:hypothetical protein L484_006483 [Morus notabilis]|uniref:Uncharacterized protein n=1 Tax=Morus notabilis TaxID=981085 RepID=W9QU99_9ROSA|nr:hypothetical protein L484_006483 [Morus notabilis]